MRYRLALSFLLALVTTVSALAGCVRRIAVSGSSSRTVALAGGNAWTLFRQYMSEVESRNLDVSLWRSEVVLFSGGKQQSVSLGWAKMLSGESAERLWERSLSKLTAEVKGELLEQADANQWDMICVGASLNNTNAVLKPPPVKQTVTPIGDAIVYYKSGIQFAAIRDYKNALREFTQAEKIKPDYPGLLMNIGVTHLQMKDYVRAADYLTRAIKQTPKDPAAHYNMACLQARLGQRDDAIQSLRAARANGMRLTADRRNDPDLASLRGMKTFQELFEKAE